MIIFMAADSIKLVHFSQNTPTKRVGILNETKGEIIEITNQAKGDLREVFEWNDRFARLKVLAADKDLLRIKLDATVRLHAPIPDSMPVYAAGVTYESSKMAREAESDDCGFYAKVYDAERPEIFFKALPGKAVGHGAEVGIRKDAKWNVPEPEVTLIFNSRGERVGHTIGNDMSSRDIEGENALYLPQAKAYKQSCALGPYVVIRDENVDDEQFMKNNSQISMQIIRGGKPIDFGDHPMTSSFAKMRRTFADLKDYLFRSQDMDQGAALLTGTCVVPPSEGTVLPKGFTLEAGDKVRITIEGIGTLENTVTVV